MKLAHKLTGRAQQAYAAMCQEDALCYNELKKAILRHCDISEDTCMYHRYFWSETHKDRESFRDLEIWLTDLVQK